jgi:hypothetical protein
MVGLRYKLDWTAISTKSSASLAGSSEDGIGFQSYSKMGWVPSFSALGIGIEAEP